MKRILTVISLLCCALVLLIGLDRYFAHRADTIIRQSDFFFFDRYSYEALDWNGPQVQNCKFELFYGVYPYQTCFVKTADKESSGFDRFSYVYTAPRPRLSLGLGAPGALSMRGQRQSDYRFRLPVRDDESFKVMADGKVLQFILEPRDPSFEAGGLTTPKFLIVEIPADEISRRKLK